jgi:hypothetical protein
MKTWSLIGTSWLTSSFLLGACVDQPCGRTELSRDRIREIVDGYVEEHFGNAIRSSKREIEIFRRDCNYVYHERDVPPRPGGELEVVIDPNGNVIEFNPGY